MQRDSLAEWGYSDECISFRAGSCGLVETAWCAAHLLRAASGLTRLLLIEGDVAQPV